MLLYSIGFGKGGRATSINVMCKKKNTHPANYVSVSKMEFFANCKNVHLISVVYTYV